MHTLSPEDKRQIVQNARRKALQWLPKEADGRLDGACLFLAMGFMQAYYEWTGVVTYLQAGSANFKCVPDHLDDGKSPNYFSYQFSLAPPCRMSPAGRCPRCTAGSGSKRPGRSWTSAPSSFPTSASGCPAWTGGCRRPRRSSGTTRPTWSGNET